MQAALPQALLTQSQLLKQVQCVPTGHPGARPYIMCGATNKRVRIRPVLMRLNFELKIELIPFFIQQITKTNPDAN
jgi:hypothetical protein